MVNFPMNELNMKEIANKTGIEYSLVWRYLNAQRVPRRKHLKLIYNAGYKIEPFLFGKDWEEELKK